VAQGVLGRIRPRIFLTFRHYKGGSSSAKRTGRLYPRRNPWYSISEAERAHGSVGGTMEKISPVIPPGIDPGTFRLIAQRLDGEGRYYSIMGRKDMQFGTKSLKKPAAYISGHTEIVAAL